MKLGRLQISGQVMDTFEDGILGRQEVGDKSLEPRAAVEICAEHSCCR